MEFSTCHKFFEDAEATANKLMTWEGELYLELHNGTYTNMAEHKHYNRFTENLLRDLEIFTNFAEAVCGKFMQPEEITDMWRIFLIDQFHDVLPGTCTELTVQDTRKNHNMIRYNSKNLFDTAMTKLSQFFKVAIDGSPEQYLSSDFLKV